MAESIIFPSVIPVPGWCRIYVIFARNARKAVIFRRGPSKWTQQILWNTDTDEFTYGQWIAGRLAEESSDLSPTGDLLVYFVKKYGSKDEAYITFTAISRPPTFTALALWPLGNSWSGGGYFIDDQTLFLDHRDNDKCVTHPEHPNTIVTVVCPQEPYNELPRIWPRKIVTGDWKHIADTTERHEQKHYTKRWFSFLFGPKIHTAYSYGHSAVYERIHAQYPYVLVDKWQSTPEDSMGTKIFYLRNTQSSQEIALDNVSWADFDQQGRLIMARYGMLLACDLAAKPLEAQVLVDLNGQTPPEKFFGK